MSNVGGSYLHDVYGSEKAKLIILTVPCQPGRFLPQQFLCLFAVQNPFPDLFPLKNQRHTAVDRGHGCIGLGSQYNEAVPVLIPAIKSGQKQNPAPFLSECKFLFILIPLIKP